MIPVCLSFHAHRPDRLRRYGYFDVGRRHDYFDEAGARAEFRRAAERCYRPAVRMLERLLDENPGFAFSLCLSIPMLDRTRQEAPDLTQAFRRLAASGRVELLGSSSHRSAAWRVSQEELGAQIALHRDRLREDFGREPAVFAETEGAGSDELARLLEERGFSGMLVAEAPFAGRPPHRLYRAATPRGLAILPRDDRLSEVVTRSFGDRRRRDWPLTAEKYEASVSGVAGELLSLGMDLETLGGRHHRENGIFEFFQDWVGLRLSRPPAEFLTPSAALERLSPGETVSFPPPAFPAENELQRDALASLGTLERRVKTAGSPALLADFRRLTASDHFEGMATRPPEDTEPAGGRAASNCPYDVYISFRHAVCDLERRLPRPRAPKLSTAGPAHA